MNRYSSLWVVAETEGGDISQQANMELLISILDWTHLMCKLRFCFVFD